MNILVAPGPFKGSMSAEQAALAIADGLHVGFPEANITKLPVADGGEGTVEALVSATQGTLVEKQVHDPLMRLCQASYGILGDGKTAVIAMSSASGLSLIPLDARNPMVTTTYGTGELICDALHRGIRRVILGVGGSATVDGGMGMAQALGFCFYDAYQEELPQGGQWLCNIESIDNSHMQPGLREISFEIACDVSNPLLGVNGAAHVYGPQKGATLEMAAALEKGLEHYGKMLEQMSGRTLVSVPGVGGGGGVALPLLAFCESVIRPGVQIVLEACRFKEHLQGCHLVITGEGRLDTQTMFGKAPLGVAREAQKNNIPVIALCGSLGQDIERVHQEGITAFLPTLHYPVKETELPEQGPRMLKICACELGRILKAFAIKP